MNCPSCGVPGEPGRKFCAECGTRLTVVCPSCSATNAPTARFCGECGTRLDTYAVDATGGQAAAAPVRSAALPAAMAERRLVTVLFADLVGFTALAEGRDAEAVRELLSRYFEIARDVIERYGGTVEKFIGDAVMAVWGAPIAHEDDAERGVRAGLDLVDVVRSLGPGVQARAGVLTGEAAVTLGATNQGMVAGDLVNTASRLQSAAAPGTVLVGEATQRAASGAIAFGPAGEHTLKGKELPVAAWVALRVVSRRKGLGRSDRLEAPFVGRDAELRLLKDLFHATARERRARLVSITGQAGIGKTRLAWEFQKYVDGVVEGVWWHDGRSPSYGEGVTFWALGEMVRSRAGLLETDDPATTRTRIAESVAEHVPDEAERRWIEPALLALLGVSEPPAGGREELFRAWRTFFERMAATGTVGLLFEDLQWADAGLLDFIDHLLEWSRGVPILIITLARPDLLERRPEWGAGRRNFLALGLEPLDEASMREILEGLVPGLPAATVRSIIARADGIPLYAVETIRMLVADGRLQEIEGGFEPVGELGELAVPESLHALIAARLDALDPADRSLLQDAAVLGQSFTLAGLSAIMGDSVDALESRLHALGRADMVVQDVDPRSPERGMYAFVQSLIREVAYSTLAKRDRRTRHLAAARFFESLGEEELAGALAAHYLAAYQATPDGPEGEAVAVQARIALVAAAERASALGSPDQAVAFLEQALPVAREPAERATILERLGYVAGIALKPDLADARLTEAIEIRSGLGDTVGVYRATARLAEALLAARRIERTAALLEPVIGEVAGADPPDHASLLLASARLLASQQRFTEVVAIADEALRLAEQHELYEAAAHALNAKGGALVNLNRPIEGGALLRAARDLAVEHGLADAEQRALGGLSLLSGTRDPRATFELELEMVAFARRTGRRDLALTTVGNAGEDALRIGEWDWQARELTAWQDVEIAETERLPMEFATNVITVLRGESNPASILGDFERVALAVDDADISSSAADFRGWVALAEGRYDDARAAWVEQGDLSPLNAPFALPRAGTAAVLAGDIAGARAVLDRMGTMMGRGRAFEAAHRTIEAGVDALEGRTADALASYRSALADVRDLGLVWDEVLVGMLMLKTLGPTHPDAMAEAESVRAILEPLRARKILDRVDDLMAGAAPTDRTPARVAATDGMPAAR